MRTRCTFVCAENERQLLGAFDQKSNNNNIDDSNELLLTSEHQRKKKKLIHKCVAVAV